MNWVTTVGLIAGLLGIAGALVACGRWLHRAIVASVSEGVTGHVADQLAPLRAELSNNGGSSMKDTVEATRRELATFRIDTRKDIARLDRRIDRLYEEGATRR